MKTIVQKILIFATLILLPHYGFSQHGYARETNIDVKGIVIGSTYTKAQVIAKWGNPTKYWSGTSEFGLNEEYIYTKNQLNTIFRFGDDGVFHSFNIKSSDFAVYTTFSGGIKVGDNISRIQTIGLGTPVLQDNGNYHLGQGEDPLIFKHSNGVITQISLVSSI